MKIAFDSQAFNMQSYGGVSRYYSILANELLKKTQDVGIFAGIHKNKYLSALPAGVVSGIQLDKYPPQSARAFQWFSHCVGQLQMQRWKPDIIHETYYSSWPCFQSKSFRVTTVHDMIHEIFPEYFPARDQTTKRKKAAFSRVDHIISVSENTKRDLIDLFGIAEDKISVVHLGVDLSAFMNTSFISNNTSKPYILYVGSRHGYKNFDGFVKAFASSERLKSDFDIVAFGGGSFTNHENVLFKRCGLRHTQIRQISGDDQKLASLYSKAYVFVYPSLYEGFGLPPLEAMASGCPVVSSNTSSMPEVIRDSGEYFIPSAIEDMRSAIERVVYSGQRRSELISLGYENINDFSWQMCAKKTLDVYKKVVG
jgi:glycosyltransferase involved in cell wall biosynthesis